MISEKLNKLKDQQLFLDLSRSEVIEQTATLETDKYWESKLARVEPSAGTRAGGGKAGQELMIYWRLTGDKCKS